MLNYSTTKYTQRLDCLIFYFLILCLKMFYFVLPKVACIEFSIIHYQFSISEDRR